MERARLIQTVADQILQIERPHPIRVAVDGVDGVGKTHFADELAEAIRACGRPVIRASVDSFHNPSRVRYRLGRSSPEGYFRDSFNYRDLIDVLLAPLSPGGSRSYRRAMFDHRTNSAVAAAPEFASAKAILLFDGIFLLRPELRSYWDLALFLDAPFEVTVGRGGERDNRSKNVDAPENTRYVEGQKLYLTECTPKRFADVIINNNDLSSPEIVVSD